MDSCQKVDTDPRLMNSAEKRALCTLLLAPLWSHYNAGRMLCSQRHKHFRLKEDYFKIKCDDSFLLLTK